MTAITTGPRLPPVLLLQGRGGRQGDDEGGRQQQDQGLHCVCLYDDNCCLLVLVTTALNGMQS